MTPRAAATAALALLASAALADPAADAPLPDEHDIEQEITTLERAHALERRRHTDAAHRRASAENHQATALERAAHHRARARRNVAQARAARRARAMQTRTSESLVLDTRQAWLAWLDARAGTSAPNPQERTPQCWSATALSPTLDNETESLRQARGARTATLGALANARAHGEMATRAARNQKHAGQRLAAHTERARMLTTTLAKIRAALTLTRRDQVPAPAGATARRGALVWPIANPQISAVSDASHERPHHLTLATAPGTPVRSAGYGRVGWAGHLRGVGPTVVVEHDNGLLSIYTDTEPSVETGMWVNEGATLGTAHDDDNNGVAIIGFEIRRGTRALAPLAWLRPAENARPQLAWRHNTRAARGPRTRR